MKSIKIDNLTVSYPIVAISYDEAEKLCPKGWRIPKIWELVEIYLTSGLIKGYEKGTWRMFWADGVRRLCRSSEGFWGAYDGSRNSFDCGRVVFVKEEK